MVPNIPMKMAGGRPLPGYARSGSPALTNASMFQFGSPSPLPAAPRLSTVEPYYPFTFKAPMLSPADADAMDVDEVAGSSTHHQYGIKDAVTAGQVGLTTPGESRELLYGAHAVSHRGSIFYMPTERMNNWLAAQGPRGPAAASSSQALPIAQPHLSAVQGWEVAEHPTRQTTPRFPAVKNLAGTKHSMDPSGADEVAETGETQSKRSRLSSNIRRRLSRASEHSGMTSRFANAIPSPAVDVLSRLSFFSLGAGPSHGAERSIKIALVGDCGSGKTTFINRVLADAYIPGAPSTMPDYRVVTTVGQYEVVKVQLWDFPGAIRGNRESELGNNFFDAAVICYSIDNQTSIASVAANWKTQLASSLSVHCRPVFVLGMKKDLRLDFPTLGLSFLNEDDNDVASQRDGKAVAKSVNAAGFGECSAMTGENVAPVFKAMVNFVVANVKENERKMQQSRREEKINDTVRDTKAGFKKVGKVFSRLTRKFRK